VRCSAYKINPAAKRGFFIVIVVISILISACSEEPIIPPAEKNAFTSIIIEMAKARVEHGKFYESYGEAVTEIFADSNYDRSFIDEFLIKTSNHPEIQEQIFREISDSLQIIAKTYIKLGKNRPDTSRIKQKSEK